MKDYTDCDVLAHLLQLLDQRRLTIQFRETTFRSRYLVLIDTEGGRHRPMDISRLGLTQQFLDIDGVLTEPYAAAPHRVPLDEERIRTMLYVLAARRPKTEDSEK